MTQKENNEGMEASPKKKSHIKDEWLRIIYQEAWNQYSLEASLVHTRNNWHLGIQTAFFIIVATSIEPLLTLEEDLIIFGQVFAGQMILGFLMMLFASIGFLSTRIWGGATRTAKEAANIRWMTAKAIEVNKNLWINLADIEDYWRHKSKAESFFPWKDYPKFLEESWDESWNQVVKGDERGENNENETLLQKHKVKSLKRRNPFQWIIWSRGELESIRSFAAIMSVIWLILFFIGTLLFIPDFRLMISFMSVLILGIVTYYILAKPE